MIDPFLRLPGGPTQIQELMRRLDNVERELKALDPKFSPTVRPSKTATGTTYEATPGATAAKSNRQVWL